MSGVPKIKDEDFLFLPLGGSDEIGMNLNLYHYGGKWLMVDLGISFGDDTMPGIDVLLPDPEFIEQRRKDLVGLVITHGHLGQFCSRPVRAAIYHAHPLHSGG